MKLYFIRHAQTRGNREHRYVGSTDEPLLQAAKRQLLAENAYCFSPARIDALYVSPMRRCRETAAILFPEKEQQIIEEFLECNFGIFEYKNYGELNGDPDYQRFIDTNGESGFPQGETLGAFRDRTVRGFLKVLERERLWGSERTAALVVHGGTIMAILDRFSSPHRDYYDWQVKNGDGFAAELVQDEGTGEPILRGICGVRT